MDFGKLVNVDRVDFTLPKEDPRTSGVLAGPRAPSPRVSVGAPIWTCPQWLGKIYPRGTPAKHFLEAYGRQFNAIELNSTFYRIPDPALVRDWKDKVPADFRFSPKVHQDVSHAADLRAAQANLLRFWESVVHFEEKLGLCFLQLAPNYGFSSWGMLRQLLSAFPEPARLAIEFRHPSWFTGREIRPEVFDHLRDAGFATVITDVAGRRDVLHASLTARRVLVRFIGNELHPSDLPRIEAWVDRLADWIARGIQDIAFFVHQPTQAEVPELIAALVNGLTARTGLPIRRWEPLPTPSVDSQMSLF